MVVPDPLERPWLTVAEAGWLAGGLGRSASYDAARRGELPTIRFGRRIVVPTARLRQMLGLDAVGHDDAGGDDPALTLVVGEGGDAP